MPIEFLILLVVVIAGFAGIFGFLRRRSEKPKEGEMLLIQNQINELTRTLDARLADTQRVVREVTKELTKVGEGQKQVATFADQLRDLQDILQNPKQRGILGEYYLETLLKNVMPPGSYELQYQFPDGVIVDAAIFVKEKVIPVDAKFSLENYNRIVEERDAGERERFEKLFRQDLKNRIDETAKYVKPEFGTMEFAFMFIPAEAIYYDLLVNKVGAVKVNTQDLIQYAFNQKKVIIVSPTSFLAYLQTVLQALRALQIEESAKEIRHGVKELERHLTSYQEYMRKLGLHLGTTVGMYNSASKEFRKIDKDVMRLGGGEGTGYEPTALEKPQTSEGLDE